MGYAVEIPELDPESSDATVVEWFVDVGEDIQRGDPIAAVDLGGTTVAITARVNGVLDRICVDEGEPCTPGSSIAIVAEVDEGVSTPGASADGVATAPADARTSSGGVERPERAVTAHLQEDLSGHVEAGGFEWGFDVTERFGGSGGPTPVDYYLGALSACLASSIGIQADIRDVDLDELSVEARASPEEGSVESISLRVTVDADVDDDTLARIVETGERTCHVAELLRDDVPVDFVWGR